MRPFITTLFAMSAFVVGVVATGYFGDQGRGFNVAPFVVGAVLAAIVVFARHRRYQRGSDA